MKLASEGMRAQIEDAIKTYNKFRSPEVTAELLEIDNRNRTITVIFKGTFCRTCGFYDYFEDFAYDMLDEAKIQTKILNVNEEWTTESFKVTYAIQG